MVADANEVGLAAEPGSSHDAHIFPYRQAVAACAPQGPPVPCES